MSTRDRRGNRRNVHRGQSAALRRSAKPRDPLPPSKADLRQELEQAMQQFLSGGGEVTNIPSGTSAWEPGARPPPSQPLFTQPRDERTPVSDVVATIEARREAMKKRRAKPQQKARTQRSRRRVIYDDFGEPLRHVWVEE